MNLHKILKFILPVLLISGAFIGGVYIGREQASAHGFCFGNRREFRKEMLDRMSRSLELTGEQRQKIEKILDEQRKVFREMKLELRPSFESIHNSTQEQIAAVLDPTQRVKFEKLKEQLREIRKRRHGRLSEEK